MGAIRSTLTWSSLLLLPAVLPQSEPRELRLVREMSIKSSESDTTLPDRILAHLKAHGAQHVHVVENEGAGPAFVSHNYWVTKG